MMNQIRGIMSIEFATKFCSVYNSTASIMQHAISKRNVFSSMPELIWSNNCLVIKKSQCSHLQRQGNFKKFIQKTAHFSSFTKEVEQKSQTDSYEDNQQEEIKEPSKSPYYRKEWMENQSQFKDYIMRKGDLPWTDDDWHQVAELLSSVKWENLCMKKFYHSKNITMGRNLMDFLQRQPNKPCHLVQTFYIGLLGETSFNSQAQEEETKQLFDTLLTETELLDPASIEVLNSGLSCTRFYPECLKLLEIYKETCMPGPAFLIKILLASLQYHDSETCTFILSQLEETSEATGFTKYVPQVIEKCLADKNWLGLEMVINFTHKHGLLIHRKGLDEILESFCRHEPDKWIGKYGYIHHQRGTCVVCGHQMKKINISNDDFKKIQAAFLDQVVIGTNIFYKSTPQEVHNFVTFVQEKGPFDIVIDGLNVIHKGQPPSKLERLEKVVECFTSEGKKVLVLGNKMLHNSISNLKKTVPRPAIYLTSTTRADDAFLLYAALHSGKNTLIMSHDKLRDHKFRLNSSIRPIFHQWLKAVQIHSWFFTKTNQLIKGQHIFDIGPNKDEGGWHIPEMDMDKDKPFGNFTILCLRDSSKKTVSMRPVTDKERRNKPFIQKPLIENLNEPSKQLKTNKTRNKEWFES